MHHDLGGTGRPFLNEGCGIVELREAAGQIVKFFRLGEGEKFLRAPSQDAAGDFFAQLGEQSIAAPVNRPFVLGQFLNIARARNGRDSKVVVGQKFPVALFPERIVIGVDMLAPEPMPIDVFRSGHGPNAGDAPGLRQALDGEDEQALGPQSVIRTRQSDHQFTEVSINSLLHAAGMAKGQIGRSPGGDCH